MKFVDNHWNLTENEDVPIDFNGNRIYWSNCKWQNLLNFLQGVHASIYFVEHFAAWFSLLDRSIN